MHHESERVPSRQHTAEFTMLDLIDNRSLDARNHAR